MTKSATELTKNEIVRQTAQRYLADRIYAYLLGVGQPAKLRQIVRALDVEAINNRLVREVMANSDRFESVDRRWAPSIRYSDTKRPLERIIVEALQSAGTPQKLEPLAREISLLMDRPAEYYEEALKRFFSDSSKFFEICGGRYGLAAWLLQALADDEEDLVFRNFLDAADVEEYCKSCPEGEWDIDKVADGAAAVVKGCKQAVPVKILALIAWRGLGEDFDPVDFYEQIADDDRIVVLSDQKAYPGSAVKGWTKTLSEIAEELAALPMEPEEEEAEGPVTVTDTDKEEIVAMILDRGSASAEELLDAVVEVGPEESGYAGALESLNQALGSDDRVMWLGGTRWGKVITFPDEIYTIPESLLVPPAVPFETPEGDVYDQELEEDGFEGDLKSAIYNALAEDVSDEDPARTMYQPDGDSQRCVLKYHHKMEGTFPMCQINPEFFGVEPEIMPITLIDEGRRQTAYVNNGTRLIYGLKDFYKAITEVSGAVFHVEKTANPGEYRFRFDNEVDGEAGVDTSRSLELLDLKARFEGGEMPVYDVIKEILGKQGMPFAQIVTEVNIVKRCSRLLIASILSSYHAFHTRGKSNIWQFDAKKESQGFNKTKKKYIKK